MILVLEVLYSLDGDNNRKNFISNSDDYEGFSDKSNNDSGTSNSKSNTNDSSDVEDNTTIDTGNGLGKATSINIQYNKKDSGGRCGKGKMIDVLR